ncbi:MAG: bifunctional 4-hydroxy-2-oxoglutarate aldolase/2-dehydro-3-deoxy-phosphogluconate aldolase [Arenimonas sp.]|nr:bifunctional 4-hydroxy-2-oxoglutarate aldolase/2-dehydro-3-deoxy-phosphogluconate aldolase [Arenimonas sp.]
MSDVIARFFSNKIIPVVVIDDAKHAVPLAETLLEGGVSAIEITLRTPQALAAMEAIAKNVPNMLLTAGTALNKTHLQQVKDVGATLVVSPGISVELLEGAKDCGLVLLPGIATASELMLGLNHGLSHFKLFPASAINGIALAKAFSGPFPEAKFCTTGGITEADLPTYLAEKNIPSVGVSWLASRPAIAAERWEEIAALLLTLKTRYLS